MICRFGPWLKAAQQVPKPSEKCTAQMETCIGGYWRLFEILRDSLRLFSRQTVFMFLVKKGDGNRTSFLNLDSTDDQPAARGTPWLATSRWMTVSARPRFTTWPVAGQSIEDSGWQVVISICLRILSQARVVWCQSAIICRHALFFVLWGWVGYRPRWSAAFLPCFNPTLWADLNGSRHVRQMRLGTRPDCHRAECCSIQQLWAKVCDIWTGLDAGIHWGCLHGSSWAPRNDLKRLEPTWNHI